LNVINNPEVDQAAGVDHNREPGDQVPVQQALDPYARAYVPHALRRINTLEGETIQTRPPRQINFDAYVLTHVGSDFLPRIPVQSEPVQDQIQARVDDEDFPSKVCMAQSTFLS
jgi:hypothetical protein